jgi:NADH-quinone oxidoreductase subunit C
MTREDVIARLVAQFGSDIEIGASNDIFFPANLTVQLFKFLRDQLSFPQINFVTAIDRTESFEVVYSIRSYAHKLMLILKIRVGRDAPAVPSIVSVYGGADWYEREVFDLFGIDFQGHPDMRRLMMPDDWVGYPLRKDYQQADSYHGMPTSRPPMQEDRP